MRAFLILVAVVVLAGIGWFLFGADDGAPVTGESTTPAAEAAQEAGDAAATAVEEAGEAAEAAGNAVEGAVESAAEAATDAVEGAVEGATDAVEGAAAATQEAMASAEATLADALTADGFDAPRLREAIASSSLDDTQKQTAQELVNSAEQNPDQVQSVIDQLKTLLGL